MQSPVGPVGWLGGGRSELVTDHWPGASASSRMCVCGMNRTSADSRVSCNCDIGDKTWREDEGKPKLMDVCLRWLCIGFFCARACARSMGMNGTSARVFKTKEKINKHGGVTFITSRVPLTAIPFVPNKCSS